MRTVQVVTLKRQQPAPSLYPPPAENDYICPQANL